MNECHLSELIVKCLAKKREGGIPIVLMRRMLRLCSKMNGNSAAERTVH
jgi:hypothetical protein